jgi:hypothetical protein
MTVTITPLNKWSIVEFDLGDASLTEAGSMEYLKLVHAYLTQDKAKSCAQWQLKRGLVKVRTRFLDEFSRALRDIIDVNVSVSN